MHSKCGGGKCPLLNATAHHFISSVRLTLTVSQISMLITEMVNSSDVTLNGYDCGAVSKIRSLSFTKRSA